MADVSNSFMLLLNEFLPPEVVNDYDYANVQRYIPVMDLNALIRYSEKSGKLEFLWEAYKYSILNIQQLLTIVTNDSSLEEQFKDLVIKMTTCQLEDSSTFLNSIITTFIQIKYSSKEYSQQMTDMVERFLDIFGKGLLQKAINESVDECINVYEIAARNELIDLEVLKKYFAEEILRFVSGHSTEGNNNFQYIISKQSDWTYSKINNFTKTILSELLLPFNSKEVEDIFKQILELPNINWRLFLFFVTHFLVLFEDGPNILRDSLINLDENKVITAIVLTRQAVNEGILIHQSYGEWIKTTFNEYSGCITNKKSFCLLIKILTDLVPFEPVCCLQAHILNPPFIPNNCRNYFSDYIILAKTRLQDLKVFDDKIFKYGNQSTEQSEEAKKKVIEEVDNMVKAFEANGKIPGQVIELSIFRKPYFLTRFLPVLLSTNANEVKQKFIESLNKLGKIPNQLYQQYVSDCDKLKTEDIAICDNQMEELRNLFEKLPEKIINGLKLKVDFYPQNDLQEIKRKISALTQCAVSEQKELIYLNSTNDGISLESKEVANLLILSLCKTLCAVANLTISHLWADELLLLFSRFKNLQSALFLRLWEIITKLGLTLQDYEMWLLSAMLVHLGTLQQFFNPVALTTETNSKVEEEKNIASLIINNCPCETDEELQFLLKFSSYYMQYAFLHYTTFSTNSPINKSEAFIPKVLIQKYSLVLQLYPNTQSSKCPTLIRNLYNSNEYFTLYNSLFN